MVAKKNLMGMKFGSLTVIEDAGSNKDGRSLWLCRCNCGKERIAIGKDLGKKITMCPNKCVLLEDLTDKKIGNLLVLKLGGLDKNGFRQYICRCMTPLKDIENDRNKNFLISREGFCEAEILINGASLKQCTKNLGKRHLPKCCQRCSRILGGRLRRRR